MSACKHGNPGDCVTCLRIDLADRDRALNCGKFAVEDCLVKDLGLCRFHLANHLQVEIFRSGMKSDLITAQGELLTAYRLSDHSRADKALPAIERLKGALNGTDGV